MHGIVRDNLRDVGDRRRRRPPNFVTLTQKAWARSRCRPKASPVAPRARIAARRRGWLSPILRRCPEGFNRTRAELAKRADYQGG